MNLNLDRAKESKDKVVISYCEHMLKTMQDFQSQSQDLFKVIRKENGIFVNELPQAQDSNQSQNDQLEPSKIRILLPSTLRNGTQGGNQIQ